jgi:hypothetical protein
MFFRKKTITETIKRADDLSGIVEVEASSLSEDQYRRYEAKRYRDMLYRNMVIVRRECRKQLTNKVKRDPLYQHLTWRKYLMQSIQGSSEQARAEKYNLEGSRPKWEEVQMHPIHMILSDPCDSVLAHIDIDEEFREMMRYRMESDGPEHHDIVWLTGSTYKVRSTSWQIDKKKFDETESVLEGVYETDKEKDMSVKFLSSIGLKTKKKAVKIDYASIDKDEWLKVLSDIHLYHHLIEKGEEPRRDTKKRTREAITLHRDTNEYELKLYKNNSPLKFGTKSSLFFSAESGSVLETLQQLAKGMKEGELDAAIKAHRKRVKK